MFNIFNQKLNTMKSKYYILIIVLSHIVGIGYGQSNLIPPDNLQATVNGNDILLNWNQPDTSNSLYLSWDNGNEGNSIGFTGPGQFSVAARWDSVQLADYNSYSISKIAFFIPGQISNYTANIWQGPNADSVAFSQTISQNQLNDWTFVYPSNPVGIDILQDLWVGYEVVQPDVDFTAGTDFGPAIQGFGDMINYDGMWLSMSQTLGLDFNFNIRVYLVSPAGNSVVLKSTKKASSFEYANTEKLVSQKLEVSGLNPTMNVTANLQGYNIYRNGILVSPAPVTDTSFYDASLDFGIYEYGVTAVYDEGESNPVVISTQIGNPEMVIFPEEITDSVIIGNYYEKIITIYNEGDVDLYWNAIASDYWTYVSPPSGIIAPNNGIDIQLFINTYYLVAGEYSTEILFFQNNINNPTIILPVNITAIGSPGISVSPQELSFGDVIYGSNYSATLNIFNTGTETLVIDDVSISNSDYSIGDIPTSIEPYGQESVMITFDANTLGESQGSLTILSNDEINPELTVGLSAYVYLQPPVLLQAEVEDNNVTLTWDMAINGEGEWVHWDNGENFNSIGLTGGGTFQYAARWEPTQLNPYSGMIVPKVAFYPAGANTSYTLKIWKGANASTLLVSQPINSFINGQWNEVYVQNPISIDASEELWVGLEVMHPDGDFPAGSDAGPAVTGFGDMVNLFGVWESISAVYGLDQNWNIQFYALSGDSTFTVQNNPIVLQEPTKFYNQGKLTQANKTTQGNNSFFAPQMLTEDPLGYNVYRNDVLLNEELILETTYFDENLPFGVYDYGVTAVYDLGESPQTQTMVQVGAPNIVFNPEAISDSLETNEVSEHIVSITNDGNFSLEWYADPQASWITLSANNGMIEPGESFDLTINLNSAGLFNGNYQSYIMFEVNNLNNPVVFFPVDVNVSGDALLIVTPDTTNFGMTALGMTKTAYVTISNLGNDYIFITDMQASPGVFTTQSFPFYLYPGGVVSLGVNFSPDSLGTFTGTFTVFTDDPEFPSVQSVLTGTSLLPQPLNFTAEIDSNNVMLDWQNPFGGFENYLQYSDNQSATGIGYTDSATFMVAAKFGPEDLMIFAGSELTQLGFIPWSETAEFTIKVWMGENAESLILSQPVSDLTPYEWNDYNLEYSIPIDTSDFLWIGYEVSHDFGDFPAGCDFGPAVTDKGDLISTDGVTWLSLSYYGLPFNWNIRGYVDTGEKSYNLSNFPNLEQKSFSNSGVLKSVISPTPENLMYAPSSTVLQGYNVYRNGSLLNDTGLVTVSEFDDLGLDPGLYSYEVSAVYDIGESMPAGPLEIIIAPPAFAPEGWNHHNTGMTHIIHIPTEEAQNEGMLSPGDWIGVFYNDNGELKC
jgi:hypothetical protein